MSIYLLVDKILDFIPLRTGLFSKIEPYECPPVGLYHPMGRPEVYLRRNKGETKLQGCQ